MLSHLYYVLTDVLSRLVADLIAKLFEGRCYCPMLKPLVGRSPHHVMNNLEFLESIKGIQLQPEECMVSYDVEALFTSVPVKRIHLHH